MDSVMTKSSKYDRVIRRQGERVAGLVLMLVSSLAMASGSATTEPPKLTVFAAAGSSDAVRALAAGFERRTGVRVDLGLASSSTLARQIEAGARADIFISANTQWMDYLQQHGLLLADTRRTLAINRLVLIVPLSSDLSLELRTGVDLATLIGGRVAMGDPAHVPAGMYARAALEFLGSYEALEPQIVGCPNVRAALALVESGQVAAGIVYRSDACISERVRIVAVFPEWSHDPIEFQIGLVPGARPPAGELVDFLTSPQAQPVLASYGFDTGQPAHSDAVRRHADAPATNWLPTAEEWRAIRTSMTVAAGCVAVLAVPGILLAYLLARKDFRGKVIVEALLHAPLVVPPVVTGYLLLVLLGNNGLIGRWLHRTFGLELAFTLYGAVIAAAVMALPLMVRSVRVAMELCDRRLEEAAGTLGAGPIRTFLTVTVPLALPGILGGMILAFARSFGEFGATAIFVGNIESRSRTLPLAIYSQLQTASAGNSVVRLVVFSIVVSLSAMALSEIMARKARQRAEGRHAT